MGTESEFRYGSFSNLAHLDVFVLGDVKQNTQGKSHIVCLTSNVGVEIILLCKVWILPH